MDVFSRAFLPVAAEARVPTLSLNRHMSVLRQCVQSGDTPVLVTRCTRPDRPAQGEYLLLLTYRRLVVTQRSRLLHRLRLHLNHDLRHLSNVTWNPDHRLPAVELAATAIDGVRERFLIRASHVQQMWQIDALLGHVFRPRVTGGRPDTARRDVNAPRPVPDERDPRLVPDGRAPRPVAEELGIPIPG